MMINQDSDQTVTPIDAEEVTAALTAILTTDKFAASPQMSAFLKYVVEQTMIGNTRRIKAFEKKGMVDLPGAGCVASWRVRDLDMRDAGLQPPKGGDQIALHDLNVIEIVL